MIDRVEIEAIIVDTIYGHADVASTDLAERIVDALADAGYEIFKIVRPDVTANPRERYALVQKNPGP